MEISIGGIWHRDCHNGTVVRSGVRRAGDRPSEILARIIVRAVPGQRVFYRNGNKLDCREANLRIVDGTPQGPKHRARPASVNVPERPTVHAACGSSSVLRSGLLSVPELVFRTGTNHSSILYRIKTGLLIPDAMIGKRAYFEPSRASAIRVWMEHRPQYTGKDTNERQRMYWRASYQRRLLEPEFRIRRTLAARIREAIKRAARLGAICKKSSATTDLLGCGIPEVIGWLERQFKPKMSWDNFGDWQIDHKRPCAAFDLSNPDQQRKCFHFTNLQPLWKQENLSKHDKCPPQIDSVAMA